MFSCSVINCSNGISSTSTTKSSLFINNKVHCSVVCTQLPGLTWKVPYVHVYPVSDVWPMTVPSPGLTDDGPFSIVLSEMFVHCLLVRSSSSSSNLAAASIRRLDQARAVTCVCVCVCVCVYVLLLLL